ncbi:polysaccharide biosynthesis tyrosine autokinase [Pseudonocardia sp.]|uniref:polysaccharide biosynthesis tyrosine autokinase n=1 Tax=Pseudonocardia sp. TaxID=60912 RepID=UPI003D0D6F11
MTAANLSLNLTASVTPETALITLTYTDTSAGQAREVVNEVGFQFSDFVDGLQPDSGGAGVHPKVALVQPAVTPERPISPSYSQNIGLGAVVGIVAGLLLANLRLRTRRSVSTLEAIEATTGAPVYATVPRIPRGPGSVLKVLASDSGALEGYREVRTNLMYGLRNTSSSVVALLSPSSSEGRTTTTIGVAVALSALGYGVALVDGDLRSCGLTREVGLVDAMGFTDAVVGACSINQAKWSISDATFDVFPAGGNLANPSELLSSRSTRHALSELGRMYDYVIVDTPPALAFTDATVLSAECDGVILVAKYAETDRDRLGTVVARVKLVDARVLGTVLNLAPTVSGRSL